MGSTGGIKWVSFLVSPPGGWGRGGINGLYPRGLREGLTKGNRAGVALKDMCMNKRAYHILMSFMYFGQTTCSCFKMGTFRVPIS